MSIGIVRVRDKVRSRLRSRSKARAKARARTKAWAWAWQRQHMGNVKGNGKGKSTRTRDCFIRGIPGRLIAVIFLFVSEHIECCNKAFFAEPFIILCQRLLAEMNGTIVSPNFLTFTVQAQAAVYKTGDVCAAFLANIATLDATVNFIGNSYRLPAWSVSILPDCFATSKEEVGSLDWSWISEPINSKAESFSKVGLLEQINQLLIEQTTCGLLEPRVGNLQRVRCLGLWKMVHCCEAELLVRKKAWLGAWKQGCPPSLGGLGYSSVEQRGESSIGCDAWLRTVLCLGNSMRCLLMLISEWNVI
ncbi:hypothetical protein RJT34_32213 [Clitoria ternatea]|uniref:Beta-galactosidase beta-sandwich domain-containing protein n=1 Tax=Clitoria ternatea TaxID=43366 RepID=A0AAN9EX06_CLITE